MPKDELPNHNCIKHLRSVVQQQQTRIAELEKTSAEHKHQLAEQVGPKERRGEPVLNKQMSVCNRCVTMYNYRRVSVYMCREPRVRSISVHMQLGACACVSG